ncbi:MAG: T9SS type A sorting domain-containing protein [Algoriphagus sp.]|nr:T9SS type A sorting domain-containing protein [Algoriphagus sp.]
MGISTAFLAIFRSRIYSIFLAVVMNCLYPYFSNSQEINSYRTINSGNFSNVSIWEIFNGSLWQPAITKPGSSNDIYINQTHLLTLNTNEQAKSVFINAETGAGQKLNLNNFQLEIYGSLQAFSGAAPGAPSGTWNSQNWIGNSINSRLVFKGTSRIIIPNNAWSGFTTNSRYSVVFDPGNGVELIVEEPFKALRFTVQSGSVRQKLNTSLIPATCATFSFNTETGVYGAGPFGDFIIESGGSLVSECNNNILVRSVSGSISASLFDLKTGGELILEGTTPRIEAATYQLNGKVIFRGGSSLKTFLAGSFPDAGLVNSVYDLEVQGTQNLTLPSELSVSGDLIQSGSGQFLTSASHLKFIGSEDQEVIGFSLSPQDLTLDKSGGTLTLNENLNILRNLNLDEGRIDFQGKSLFLNSSSSGGLNYEGGSLKNLSSFNYLNIPGTFNATNGTFPFEDRYQGGVRKVQLLGNTAGGSLTINFTEYDGAEYNSGFVDTDGTPILYRLFSYFQFSGLAPSSNPIELRISAAQLIVDEVDDLRIVGTGYAAPGSHLPGLDPVELWARRGLTISELSGVNFTVGSYRTLSVLPVEWLDVMAKYTLDFPQLNWSVAQEKDNEKFEVYRSENPAETWEKVGEVKSKGDSETKVSYAFSDESLTPMMDWYYQVKQIDLTGKWSWSKVVLLKSISGRVDEKTLIFPNPYFSGSIGLILSGNLAANEVIVSISSSTGVIISTQLLEKTSFLNQLESLKSGLYLIRFSSAEESQTIRWVKR